MSTPPQGAASTTPVSVAGPFRTQVNIFNPGFLIFFAGLCASPFVVSFQCLGSVFIGSIGDFISWVVCVSQLPYEEWWSLGQMLCSCLWNSFLWLFVIASSFHTDVLCLQFIHVHNEIWQFHELQGFQFFMNSRGFFSPSPRRGSNSLSFKTNSLDSQLRIFDVVLTGTAGSNFFYSVMCICCELKSEVFLGNRLCMYL